MLHRSSIVNREMHDWTRNKEYAFPQDGFRLPPPKPSDWRDDMTVCIGAICENGRAIVTATDRMISCGDYTSGDSIADKGSRFHKNWAVLFAGEVSAVDPVIRAAGRTLSRCHGTLSEVKDAFRAAYQREEARRREDKVLSVLGYSMASFRRKGRQELGDNVYREVWKNLRDENLGITFLVHGFEPQGSARLFTVESGGHIQEHRRVGFWSIGYGLYNALTMLFFHQCGIEKSLTEAIYLCCEAKFMAESAPSVGKATIVGAMKWVARNKIDSWISNREDSGREMISSLRELWENQGQPRIPDGIKAVIEKAVDLGPMEPFQA
jgi:hypothetical protein